MQDVVGVLDLYADANSGKMVVAMAGKHCLKTWSKTQATVAKSSAES